MINKKTPKILIIDDVDTNRFLLRDIIAEMGYQPVLAENGAQALKVIERVLPLLIISDVAMPEMGGYELCKVLKDNPVTREIPIIFISAFDNTEDVVRGFEVGGEDYITKPFLPEIVKARVGLHLKLADANRVLSETNRLLQASVSKQLLQIEMEKKNVLYALTRVARENAAYDEQHMERVIYNCKQMAEAMQLSPEYGDEISDTFIETLAMAAPLCDLGNVAISTELLQKPDALNSEERVKMQRHTIIGSKILKDIASSGDYNDFLKMSYELALYHHEHYDGSGYPEQIAGDDIPLCAQIMSVVGDFCSLTEKRTYRDAYTREETLEIMREDDGVKYNPVIFKLLQMIVRQLH